MHIRFNIAVRELAHMHSNVEADVYGECRPSTDTKYPEMGACLKTRGGEYAKLQTE